MSHEEPFWHSEQAGFIHPHDQHGLEADRCVSSLIGCSSDLEQTQHQDQHQHSQLQLRHDLEHNQMHANTTGADQVWRGPLQFDPGVLNFSDLQETWIRKPTIDILGRVLLVAPIVILGILGNLVIIYSMCRFKPFRSKPTNIFILNLAVADLLTTLVCPTAALFTDIYQFYVLGPYICRVEGFVKVTCLLVSSYSLIVLSTDWLLCVVKPCRARITIRKSWFALASIWVFSLSMASPLLVWRQLRQRQWLDLLEVWCCEMIEYTKYYWVLITFFLIYLPTIFMTIVLLIILAQMDRFEAKLRKSRPPSSTNNVKSASNSLAINIKYRRRIVKILFTYLLTSIVCWTPLQFTIIYRHFRSEAIPSSWFFELAFYAQLSASLTAAMNPIIFGFLSESFRQAPSSWLRLRPTEGTNKQVPADTRRISKPSARRHLSIVGLKAIGQVRQQTLVRSSNPESSRRVNFKEPIAAPSAGRDNLAFQGAIGTRMELHGIRISNSTTSFMRTQSPVSMHSINIEENLDAKPRTPPPVRE